jgi:hypothetical protein
MKMADVLHSIADLLGTVEEKAPAQAQAPVVVNVNNIPGSGEPVEHSKPESADQLAIDAVQQDHKHEPELKDKPMMVPPLQQKLEIMKKLAGMPNQAEHFTAAVADEDEPVEG